MTLDDFTPCLRIKWQSSRKGVWVEYLPLKSPLSGSYAPVLAAWVPDGMGALTSNPYLYSVDIEGNEHRRRVTYRKKNQILAVDLPIAFQEGALEIVFATAPRTVPERISWLPNSEESETVPMENDAWSFLETPDDAIRSLIEAINEEEKDVGDGVIDVGLYSAVEGRQKLRRHFEHERSATLVKKFKAMLKEKDSFSCEACGFNFAQMYGEHGAEFIEAHHKLPLKNAAGPRETNVDALAAVCSNCHRMLHRLGELTVEDLKLLIEKQRLLLKPST